MSCYNRVILIGHTTHTPQLNFTADSGKAVCEVGLAVNERYKRDDQWVEEVTFVDVTYWGNTAEVIAEYCPKGTPLLVEGKLKQDTWESDGQKRSKLRVVCQKMLMIGGPKKNGKTSSNSQELTGAGATSDKGQF